MQLKSMVENGIHNLRRTMVAEYNESLDSFAWVYMDVDAGGGVMGSGNYIIH